MKLTGWGGFNSLLWILSWILFLLTDTGGASFIIFFWPTLMLSLVLAYEKQEEIPKIHEFFGGQMKRFKGTIVVFVVVTLGLFFLAMNYEILSFFVWNGYACASVIAANYIGAYFDDGTEDASKTYYPEQTSINQKA